MPAPPGLSLSASFAAIAEELKEAERCGLEQFFDPWNRTTDASSRGSWSVMGPLLFWELSGEEKGHQCKKNVEMSQGENESKVLSLSEVALERQSMEGWLGWMVPFHLWLGRARFLSRDLRALKPLS